MPRALGVPSLQVARISAALPGAGAWDATPLTLFISEADQILLTCTYTRGAAGGACDVQLQVSPYSVPAVIPAGAGEWAIQTLYESGAVVAGADTQSRVQREYYTYQATAAGAEVFVIGPIAIEYLERLRVRARESGVPGTPGTLAITLTEL